MSYLSRQWVTTLDEGRVPDASSSVGHLLRHALEKTIGSRQATATELLEAQDGANLDAAVLAELDTLCERRLNTREPVQVRLSTEAYVYLCGHECIDTRKKLHV